QRLAVEGDQADQLHRGGGGGDGGHGDAGGVVPGIAVDPRGDGGEGDRAGSPLVGDLQAAPVGPGQQLGLPVLAVAVAGAHGVDDPAGGQAKAGGGLGVARGAAAQRRAGGV